MSYCRKSPLDVEVKPIMQNPYQNTTGVLSDPRITDEHLGRVVRQMAKENPINRSLSTIVEQASVIAAKEEVNAAS